MVAQAEQPDAQHHRSDYRAEALPHTDLERRGTPQRDDQLDWSLARMVREGSHTQQGTESTGAPGLSDPGGAENYVNSFKKKGR